MVQRGNPFDFGPTNFGFELESKRDSRRSFTRTQKNEIWAQQDGKCAICHKKLDPRTVQYDHGRAWSAGGTTTVKNGRALCSNCHSLKSHKDRLKKVEKTKRRGEESPFDIKLPKIRL
jgi:5-methylcytosine-specific restriction endonuclease McrA